MSPEVAAQRLARLAAHLDDAQAPSTSSLGPQPTSASGAGSSLHAATATAADGAACTRGGSGTGDAGSTSWHQQCFSFEPGRLLLDQVLPLL